MRIQKLREDAIVPTRASENAAGYDLYAADSAYIAPGTMHLIHTGIAVEIPDDYFGAVYARSGLATKEGLRPANCVGVIDSDFRGELKVALYNDSEYARTVDAGERIAQLVIIPYEAPEIEVVDELSETARGNGGFGSTGK